MTKDGKKKSGSVDWRRKMAEMAVPINPVFPELFALGRIVATCRAEQEVSEDFRYASLLNHQWRNWGNFSQEDRALKEAALAIGGRLASVYRDEKGNEISITTEADRSMTTIDLVDDE